MPEQIGDVVYEIRTASSPSTVVLRRHTWKSIIAMAAGLACLGGYVWFHMHNRPMPALGALVGALTLQGIGRRWSVEERYPKPRAATDKRVYRLLEAAGIASFIAVMSPLLWVGLNKRTDLFWVVACALALFAVVSQLFSIASRRFLAQAAGD